MIVVLVVFFELSLLTSNQAINFSFFFEVRLRSTLSFSDVSAFGLDENLYPMRMYADVKFTPKIMVVQISNVLRFIRTLFLIDF